jgi:hypothetical protein
MSELETALLEYWTVSAKEWRRRNHIYQGQEEIEEPTPGSRRTKKLVTKVCAQCGAEFEGRALRKYCSEKCYREAEREAERRRARAKRLAGGLPVRPRPVRGIWQSVELADTAQTNDGFRCIVCGAPFVPNPNKQGGWPSRYCSQRCLKRASVIRARQRELISLKRNNTLAIAIK